MREYPVLELCFLVNFLGGLILLLALVGCVVIVTTKPSSTHKGFRWNPKHFTVKSVLYFSTAFSKDKKIKFLPNNSVNSNAHWVTGFVDAEGSFGLYIYSSKVYRSGWTGQLYFQLSLHSRDMDILEDLKNYDPPNSSVWGKSRPHLDM